MSRGTSKRISEVTVVRGLNMFWVQIHMTLVIFFSNMLKWILLNREFSLGLEEKKGVGSKFWSGLGHVLTKTSYVSSQGVLFINKWSFTVIKFPTPWGNVLNGVFLYRFIQVMRNWGNDGVERELGTGSGGSTKVIEDRSWDFE